jgi:ubiquinone/menaquinone biosynthesis C-methylase UbiE
MISANRAALQAMTLWSAADLVGPMAIRVASTLRIPDRVFAGADTVEALARECGVDANALYRLLRLLTTVGIVSLDDGSIELTDLGQLLRSDHPESLRGWFDLDGFGGRLDGVVLDLLEVVRSGRPAYERVHGLTMWEDFAANPTIAGSFDRLMEDQAEAASPHIVSGFDWSKVRRLVDVGGGTGVVAAWLARANPGLEVTVLDLPAPVEQARQRFIDLGLTDRCRAVSGSFFDSLPEGADVYLLSRVVHDWPDDDATRILARCRRAAGDGGRVVLVDTMLDEDRPRGTATTDLQMLALFGGRERTRSEYERLLTDAGFVMTRVEPLQVWGRVLIEAVPRGTISI